MTTMTTRIPALPVTAALLCAFAFVATPAHANGKATSYLKSKHTAVERILAGTAKGNGASAARDKKLKGALSDLLDYAELSKRALSDHWEGLTQAQRDEFVGLLSALVERSYQKNLESTLGYAISYGSESRAGDSVVVHTTARSKKNRRAPEVTIDYALQPSNGGYRVYDVTTDGVSLVANYRRQFNRIIKKDGWDALLERMRKKLAADGDAF
jgi:phospholipid transport system substrate-binding protein